MRDTSSVKNFMRNTHKTGSAPALALDTPYTPPRLGRRMSFNKLAERVNRPDLFIIDKGPQKWGKDDALNCSNRLIELKRQREIFATAKLREKTEPVLETHIDEPEKEYYDKLPEPPPVIAIPPETVTLEEQFYTDLANIILGEKIPLDIWNDKTGELIIPTNRKITATSIKKLVRVTAAREDNEIGWELDPSPVRSKLTEIAQRYLERKQRANKTAPIVVDKKTAHKTTNAKRKKKAE